MWVTNEIKLSGPLKLLIPASDLERMKELFPKAHMALAGRVYNKTRQIDMPYARMELMCLETHLKATDLRPFSWTSQPQDHARY